MTALGAMIGMLPITIANFGVRELTFIGFLGLLGVPSGQALTVALIMFAIGITQALAGGALDLLVPEAAPAESSPLS